MATKLFIGGGQVAPLISRGTNDAKLDGTLSGWVNFTLDTTAGGASGSYQTATVLGPTNGIEHIADGTPREYISPPVAANVTIAGTITFNIWASEVTMNDNVAINCILERLSSTGEVLSTIVKTARVTELALSAAVNNFTAVPTSTTLLKGERIRCRVFGDDVGTMGAAGAFWVYIGGPTAAAQGDTWISFTENFSFQSTDPTGTQLFLNDTAAGVSSAVTNSYTADPLLYNAVYAQSAGTNLIGQSFLGTGGKLAAASFYVSRFGNPVGTLTAAIYAHTGTFGSFGGLATGSPLATSTSSISYSSLGTGTGAWYTFSFDGSFTMVSGTAYVIVLTMVTTSGDSTNRINIFGAVPANDAGTGAYNTSGTWSAVTQDFGYQVYSVVGREMQSSRGAVATTAVVTSVNGWTAPIPWTKTAGGTAIEWYSKQLNTFTLDGVVGFNLRAMSSGAYIGIRAELAVCNDDGSNAVVWASTIPASQFMSRLPTSQTAMVGHLAAPPMAVAQGQRLRFRVYADDTQTMTPMTAGTGTFYYNGPTAAASGDSWIQLPQSVTEYAPKPAVTQAAYQFYADGTETASAALAAQDTAPTISLINDVNMQLRVRMQSTSATAVFGSEAWHLEWDKNNSGVWRALQADGYDDNTRRNNDNPTGQSGQPQRTGHTFIGDGEKLVRAGFYIGKASTPTNNWTAKLYAHTGTYGVDGVGTGTPLATSNTINAASFTSVGSWTYFDFDGTYTMVNGTPYVIVIEADAPSVSSWIVLGQVAYGSGQHPGNEVYGSLVTWSAQLAGYDILFKVISTSGIMAGYNSASLTDGAATTNRLGAGTGSFAAGEVSETLEVFDLGLAAGSYTELLYSFTLKSAGFLNADTLRFRITRSGTTESMTYSVVPSLSVTMPSNTFATISTNWGTWTASATAVRQTAATVATNWGTLSTTATAVRTTAATISTNWGTWTGAAAGAPDRTATINDRWIGGSVRAFDTRSPVTNVTNITDPITIGNKLTFAVAGKITKLWHYRSPNSNQTAHTLKLWRSNGTLVGTAVTSGESGSGWFSATLPSEVAVSAAEALIVSVDYISGEAYMYRNTGLYTSDEADITFNNSYYNVTLGSFPNTDNGVVNFFSDVQFLSGGWTATATAVVTKVIQATVSTNWGTWTAAATAQVIEHPAVVATSWGTWVSTATAGVSHVATSSQSWATWNATATAVRATAATSSQSWGTWTAGATGVVTQGEILATISTNWGTWLATAAGIPLVAGNINEVWGPWASTATAVRSTAASSTQSWGTWTGTATAIKTVTATVVTSWGTWTAAATAQPIVHPATITTSWGTWTTAVSARRTSDWSSVASATTQPGFANVPATIITNWGTWAATATAAVGRAATITTNWGTWTATGSIPFIERNATITTNWGTWNATGGAIDEHPSTIVTSWGTWNAQATGIVIAEEIFATITSNWLSVWAATGTATVSRPATITTSWGTWTATATSVVNHPASITSVWGWTATASALRETYAGITTSWGQWSSSATATINRFCTIDTNWGTWTATATSAVNATINSNLGTWTASATAVVNRAATIATNWGSWSATATAVRGTFATTADTWACTLAATAIVGRSASISTAWGGWSATATATVDHPATITTSWGTWTATATAGVAHTASITTNWGTWNATAIAFQEGQAVGFINTIWSAWTATATAQPILHFATITTTWAWTATAAAGVDHTAAVASNWGTWTATAAAQPIQRNATVTSNWGTWTSPASATVTHVASITTSWGTWSATAAGTVVAEEIFATVASNWGGWNATAVASIAKNTVATISSNWGTWTATSAAGVSHSASTSITYAAWTATATAQPIDHPASISTTYTAWSATASALVSHSASISTTYTWTATASAVRGTTATAAAVYSATFHAFGVIVIGATAYANFGRWEATAEGVAAPRATTLNEADKVYLGDEEVDRIFLDGVKVWELV